MDQQHLKIHHIFLATAVFVLTINSSLAYEKITIESDEQIKDLIGTWKCILKDEYVTGFNAHFTFDSSISLNNISGNAKNEYCPCGQGSVKGKVEKGILIMETRMMPAPCAPTETDQFTVYKSSEGNYSLKGIHNYTHANRNSSKYTSTCTRVSN